MEWTNRRDTSKAPTWWRSYLPESGSFPDYTPPILQRLNMRPEQYLANIRKPKLGFAKALGALDKLKEYAEHFGKTFIKGQTAAAALFSPGR